VLQIPRAHSGQVVRHGGREVRLKMPSPRGLAGRVLGGSGPRIVQPATVHLPHCTDTAAALVNFGKTMTLPGSSESDNRGGG
jgi:hypothetical protein